MNEIELKALRDTLIAGNLRAAISAINAVIGKDEEPAEEAEVQVEETDVVETSGQEPVESSDEDQPAE